MNANPTPRPALSLAALPLGLAALASPAAAQEPTYAAETYGVATGDVPLPDLGLVLELVDNGTPEARLRLFGGCPGHPAAIFVSMSRSEEPAPGPANGASALVGSSDLVFQGTFDWLGTFEVPLGGLGELGPDDALFVQGVHTGLFDYGDGPLVQLSHGLELRAPKGEEPLAFEDFAPHLPAKPELPDGKGLAPLLQAMLNSTGDSTRIAVEIEATAGLGVEVVDVKAGGRVGVEFQVERTEEGLYEVTVGADVAALAGASVGTGAEAGVEGSQGMGATRIFRFHSAPGAARGMLGMVLSLSMPEVQPHRWIAGSGLLGDAGERMAALQESLQYARDHAEELERYLWQVLDGHIANLTAVRDRARSEYERAARDFYHAPRFQRGRHVARMLFWRSVLGASQAHLHAALFAREQGERALDAAKAVVEAKRDELMQVMEALGRVGRIAFAVAQLRDYTTLHYAGTEVRFANAVEAEAALKIPFVSLKNVGASYGVEAQVEFTLRIEPETPGRPLRASVVQSIEFARTIAGGLVVGGELAEKLTIDLTRALEIGVGETRIAESSVAFTSDTQLVGCVGAIVAYEDGVGRSRSFSYSNEEMLSKIADWSSLFTGEGIPDSAGSAEIGFELQDRHQRNIDVELGIDISGWGGGIEIEMEWADQGRLLSKSTSIREGIETLVHGAAQVVDGASGMVLSVAK